MSPNHAESCLSSHKTKEMQIESIVRNFSQLSDGQISEV